MKAIGKYLVIGLAILLSAWVLGKSYTYKYRTQDRIVVTGLGETEFTSDLIVWRQDVGWRKGSTDDVAVWRNQLQKNWSNLRSGVCYGGSGFIGHKSYTAQSEPRSNWMPEENSSREDSLIQVRLPKRTIFSNGSTRMFSGVFEHCLLPRPERPSNRSIRASIRRFCLIVRALALLEVNATKALMV